MVDVSKIRVGDEVTVKATVLCVEGLVHVRFDDEYSAWIESKLIVDHVSKPRPIAVGDTVVFKWDHASKKRYIVKAIDDGVVWLKDPDGTHWQLDIHTLVRADDPS